MIITEGMNNQLNISMKVVIIIADTIPAAKADIRAYFIGRDNLFIDSMIYDFTRLFAAFSIVSNLNSNPESSRTFGFTNMPSKINDGSVSKKRAPILSANSGVGRPN